LTVFFNHISSITDAMNQTTHFMAMLWTFMINITYRYVDTKSIDVDRLRITMAFQYIYIYMCIIEITEKYSIRYKLINQWRVNLQKTLQSF